VRQPEKAHSSIKRKQRLRQPDRRPFADAGCNRESPQETSTVLPAFARIHHQTGVGDGFGIKTLFLQEQGKNSANNDFDLVIALRISLDCLWYLCSEQIVCQRKAHSKNAADADLFGPVENSSPIVLLRF